MNMNKKIITFSILVLSLLLFRIDVFAQCAYDSNDLLSLNQEHMDDLHDGTVYCIHRSEGGYKCVYDKVNRQCVKGTVKIDACSTFTSKNKCNQNSDCKWNGNTCIDTYVAENPCNEPDIRKVLRFFGYLLLIAKVCVPLIIIGFGTFDLFKSVVDKDEKSLYKQLKQLGIRVVVGIFVFFIPNLVYAIFGVSDALNVIDGEQFKACASCLLKPTDESGCSIQDNNN